MLTLPLLVSPRLLLMIAAAVLLVLLYLWFDDDASRVLKREEKIIFLIVLLKQKRTIYIFDSLIFFHQNQNEIDCHLPLKELKILLKKR